MDKKIMVNGKITLDADCLDIKAEKRTFKIDLTRAVRLKMYNRPEMRYFYIEDFKVGNIFPSSHSLRVHLFNEACGLVIPLIFSVDDDNFRVKVPVGQIVEQWSCKQRIIELDLLPDLMSSRVGDEGFFMLPVYSGTLVKFNQQQPVVNRDRIYMEQESWEKVSLINCYAVKRPGLNLLAVVNKGDFHCWVTTEMNLNESGENRIFASLGIRHNEGELLPQEDKEIIFYHLNDADDYPQMAFKYRKYLMDEKGISPLKERIESNEVLRYSSEAMRVKIFMGMKYPFIPDGSSKLSVCTSFAQAEDILDAMKEAGIEKAVVTLVGWNLGGHDGAYPTRFPVEPELGGEEGLKKLIKKAVGMGYQIVPHDNVTDIYRPAADFDYNYTAVTEYGEALPAGLWGGGQSYKACPTVYFDRYGGDFSRIKELGFEGSYYLDAQATVMWRCHSKQHPANEEQFAVSLGRITQLPREMYGAVSCELGSAYMLPFIDEAATIHSIAAAEHYLPKIGGAFQQMVDRVVPFYQIAIHGLIFYQNKWVHAYRKSEGGTLKGLLSELAFGARPSMEVAYEGFQNGDCYLDSIKDVKAAYKFAFETMKEVHVELMEYFEELGPQAYHLKYANGVEIMVNMADEPQKGIEANTCILKIDGQEKARF
jgi:hypothetical protein